MNKRTLEALIESAKKDLDYIKKHPLATVRWEKGKAVDIPENVAYNERRLAKAQERLDGYKARLAEIESRTS